MPVVKAKPTSPGRRFVVKVVNPDLHKGEPYKPLLEKKSKTGLLSDTATLILQGIETPERVSADT